MIYYKCDHFDIEELIDKQTHSKWGEKAWMFLRADALYSLDGVRKYFGKPVWVNNWAIGGEFQFRGLRPSGCTVGEVYSQHRFGGGFDCDVEGMKADEVRKEIITHKDDEHFKLIMCLETGITWVHFDCRNILDRIRFVQP